MAARQNLRRLGAAAKTPPVMVSVPPMSTERAADVKAAPAAADALARGAASAAHGMAAASSRAASSHAGALERTIAV